jgi:Protein of unknown function (DUF2934)
MREEYPVFGTTANGAAGAPMDRAGIPGGRGVTPEEIARRAYAYWEARGRAGGSELEDWLRAERELAAMRQQGRDE